MAMTTKDLKDKISVLSLGSNSYSITIEYKNKFYTCHSNDSISYDRLMEHNYGEDDRKIISGLTYKQALQALYNECQMKNEL